MKTFLHNLQTFSVVLFGNRCIIKQNLQRRQFIRKTFVVFLVLALFTLPLFQAASQSDYKILTVYTALPDTEVPTYYSEFQKETGIKIQSVRLSAGELLARVTAEKNNPQASVWFGSSLDNFVPAGKAGFLEAYQSPSLSRRTEPASKSAVSASSRALPKRRKATPSVLSSGF